MRSIFMYYAAAALGVALLASEARAQNIKPEQPKPKPNPNPVIVDRAKLNNDRAIIARDRAILNVDRARINNGVLRAEAASTFNSGYPVMPYVYPSWTPNPWMANPWMVNPYMMNPWMPYSNLYSPFGPLSGFNSMNYWGMPFAGGMGGAGLPASGFGSGFGTY